MFDIFKAFYIISNMAYKFKWIENSVYLLIRSCSFSCNMSEMGNEISLPDITRINVTCVPLFVHIIRAYIKEFFGQNGIMDDKNWLYYRINRISWLYPQATTISCSLSFPWRRAIDANAKKLWFKSTTREKELSLRNPFSTIPHFDACKLLNPESRIYLRDEQELLQLYITWN